MKKLFIIIALFLITSPIASHAAEKPILQIDTGGHKAIIRDVIFTKDGRYLVSASDDKTIRVWDVKTGEIVRVIRGRIGAGPEGMIYAAALSPDNRYLAVGGRFHHSDRLKACVIRLTDFHTGDMVRLLKGHSNAVAGLAFSPDGRALISGSADFTARIWDVSTGRTLHILKGHTDPIYVVTFSPDGERVVTGSYDHTLRLWDVSTGSLVSTLKGHTDKVRSAAFTPDGRYLLSGSDDKTIRLWDAKSGRFIKVMATQDSIVASLSISPDSARVVTGVGSHPLTNNVFSIPSGKRLASFTKHKNIVLATAVSPDGQTAATGGGDDEEIYLWDINTGAVKRKMVGMGKVVWSLGFAKDGRSIAWGKTWQQSNLFGRGPLDQSFRLMDGRGYNPTLGRELKGDTGYLRAIESVGPLSIRTENGVIHPTLEIKKDGRVVHKITRDATTGYAHESLTLTPDGRTVISGGSNGVLTSYDPGTGMPLHQFIGHTGDVWGVAASPDSRYLVSGSLDQTVMLWAIPETKRGGKVEVDWDVVDRSIEYTKKAHGTTYSRDETLKIFKKKGWRYYKDTAKKVYPLLTIFQGTDGEWAAWTPEGFYTASPKGDKYVGWHVNKGEDKAADFYTAKQFRRYLYRPDIIRDTLALSSSRKAIKKAGLENITVADLIKRAPVDVKIAGVKVTGTDRAEVTVQLGKNKTTAPERVTLYVNGAQVLTEAERKLTGVSPGDTLRFEVPLTARNNHIRVLLENRWAETGDFTRVENPNATTGGPKGTLYVTAIGLSRYPNLPQDQQLSSPPLDAKSIADRFAKLEGRLYEKVEVSLLTDRGGEPVTSARIESILAGQAAKAGPTDTSLVFLAGHGVTDPKGSYHFVTADTEIKSALGGNLYIEKGTSLDWGRLHKILDRTMGRRFVMVDTCQAGSVFSGTRTDIKRLVKDIHDVNAVVYSGASRQQAGLETSEGGVFTRAILAGIDGRADYQNNLLPFNSLREYVDREAPRMNRVIMQALYNRGVKLTKKKDAPKVDLDGTQKPVAVLPDGMEGFVVFKR